MNDQINANNKNHKLILILVGFLLACVSTVFSILCLNNTNILFFNNNALLLSLLSAFFVCLLYGALILLTIKNKDIWAKGIVTLLIFLVFCLVLCFILIKTGFFSVIKDSASLQHYLENRGAWMPIFYILLQYLQVVVLPIPSVVSTVAGVALFGPF